MDDGTMTAPTPGERVDAEMLDAWLVDAELLDSCAPTLGYAEASLMHRAAASLRAARDILATPPAPAVAVDGAVEAAVDEYGKAVRDAAKYPALRLTVEESLARIDTARATLLAAIAAAEAATRNDGWHAGLDEGRAQVWAQTAAVDAFVDDILEDVWQGGMEGAQEFAEDRGIIARVECGGEDAGCRICGEWGTDYHYERVLWANPAARALAPDAESEGQS